MARKSIIVIGAGIAGLSAGCYGQMNGFRTRIFEMHTSPGGLCTSWRRGSYTIDGCLQWLVGTAPSSGLYRIWEELGATRGRRFVNHEEFVRIEGVNGKTFIQYSNLDRLEQHMLEMSPEDESSVRNFINSAREFVRAEAPVEGNENRGATSKPTIEKLQEKWGGRAMGEFSLSIKSPALRGIFESLWHPSAPASFFLMILSFLHKGEVGYPVGGSLAFSRSIERRYLELGGEARYGSRVAKVLVEGGRAAGVKLEDGSEHRSDYVISAADGHATIFDMLDGRYADSEIRGYYERLQPFPPLLHVALGVDRSFEDVPPVANGISFPLSSAIKVAGTEFRRLGVLVYNFDPTLAPPGKTVLKVMLPSDYDYWKGLRERPDLYRSEKDLVADRIAYALDERFPGLADRVEMRDVATPATFHRYTGNWRGSYEGWMLTPESAGLQMRKTLPGLDNFYMAGQWVEPGGGVPTSAISGRNAIKMVCEREKVPFFSTVP
ncbi:MAG: NAD(P)/FAD-dependent oxidoreductase [Candidatus Brockarchaeota archaeon]|nr:NAD(P)/FAD-dependent oxidoreductase [Candidatus Brockarchaeota archaeon]